MSITLKVSATTNKVEDYVFDVWVLKIELRESNIVHSLISGFSDLETDFDNRLLGERCRVTSVLLSDDEYYDGNEERILYWETIQNGFIYKDIKDNLIRFRELPEDVYNKTFSEMVRSCAYDIDELIEWCRL